jgi:hypothetical protein
MLLGWWYIRRSQDFLPRIRVRQGRKRNECG